MDIYTILQSPDDGTPLDNDLTSEKGEKYHKTSSGVLLLDAHNNTSLSDVVYSNPMFKAWNSIINDRLAYYTKGNTIAGLLAQWSYRRVKYFNKRLRGDWLLDIGCGNGDCIEHLDDRSTYIGIDRNLTRLEMLKQRYPEITAIYSDATLLPFKSRSLRWIFSSNTFEHIWYLQDALLELYRCSQDNAEIVIVIPTEGGLWNAGRKLLSKPHFTKKYPAIDFDFISHLEHCNEARQIVRSLETFFKVKIHYFPTGIPSIYCNIYLELHCCRKNTLG